MPETKSNNPKPKKRRRISATRIITWVLLALGLTALATSIIYSSTISAFIGLGLTFWGATLLYISPEKHVKQILLNATTTSLLTNLNKMLTQLEYQGKGIYLPPKYLKDFETSRVYIPKHKTTILPLPEDSQQQEDIVFTENPEALLLIPPGLSLLKLLEKTMGKTFTQTDLQDLQQELPRLLIEDLEIAENMDISTTEQSQKEKQTKHEKQSIPKPNKNDTTYVKIVNSVFKDTCEEASKIPNICETIGCPLCSAIACALAKASGRPVIIEKTECTRDANIIETHYKFINQK